MERRKKIPGRVACLVLAGVILSGCPADRETQELREYQGQKLSSIGDFRDNSITGPPAVDIAGYALSVTGLVEEPLALAYDRVLGDFPSRKKVVTLKCVEGWEVTVLFEGVPVREILAAARPRAGAEIAIFRSIDGYSTSVTLPYLLEDEILLGYKINGLTLPPELGYPFQLVAEGKWGYKWAKWVSAIELSDDLSFRGFWESRGYSNSGDLDESFVDR